VVANKLMHSQVYAFISNIFSAIASKQGKHFQFLYFITQYISNDRFMLPGKYQKIYGRKATQA
jgi:hypothetical protein